MRTKMGDQVFLQPEDVICLNWFEILCRSIATERADNALKSVYSLLSGSNSVDHVHLQQARLYAAFYLDSDYRFKALNVLRLIDQLEWFNSGLDWDSAEALAVLTHPKNLFDSEE